MTKHHNHEKQEEKIEQLEQEVDETQADEALEEQGAEQAGEEQGAKIQELEAENAKLKDLYMRSQAEMENLRRRTQIELEKRSKFAITSFARDLLTVADNLARAMDSVPAEERNSDLIKNLMTGLDLTQKDFVTALEKNNIKPIESIGRVFDPNLHKVVQEIEDPSKPAGTIVQEWQKGYMIGDDRVLREAVVLVSKGGPKPGEENAPAGCKVDTSA